MVYSDSSDYCQSPDSFIVAILLELDWLDLSCP
jgi:hypothetical protein